MNTKPNYFNHTKVFAATAALAIGVLAMTNQPEATEYHPSYSVNATPSEYGVQSIKLTSDTSGIAVVKLDGFRVQVDFDFEAHPDSYGVAGSEFTSVEIMNLAIDRITDVNGKEYSDFTDYNDHRNINQILSTFIEKNNLVEAA